ncbi:rhomboid family intramembrane serine protease [Lacinutrix sp. Bg11-31]|uniref:rhomboid family protein n=1 Tax=Lacinutrix sp. Bg11-31 TaxID=2057808 RepID=UPI000C310A72|nr:rhomboid family intramembrane serine protease [Lacinutrix sp. Bg11-31]AUC80877.1 rhomboid family intramembrane serine protease [Lacinutrix sp. Bg11-31]
MSLLSDLKYKYNLASVHEKIIFVNIGVFAVVALLNTVYFLATKSHLLLFQDYLALPEDLNQLIFKPWTFLTYAFMHTSFWHLLGNMIALYYFGRIFLTFFSVKQLINYYFVGGLVGGLVFVVSYNLLPALVDESAILLGASASVFSVLVGATTKSPNYVLNLFGVFQLKLWVLTVLYLISFIALIPYANAGGELSHLGGAVFGYIYTKQLVKGNDIGKGFERLLVTITSWFKPRKKGNLKTVYKDKSKVGGYTKGEFSEFNNQKKIDVILDKISKSGYESLSAAEKEYLFKAGK